MKHLALLCSIILFFSVQAAAQQEQLLAPQKIEQASPDEETITVKPSPLFILKHKRASYELDSAQLKHLDPNTIKSIEVIKGTGAVDGWGTRGQQGVVIIYVDRMSFRKFLEQESE